MKFIFYERKNPPTLLEDSDNLVRKGETNVNKVITK